MSIECYVAGRTYKPTYPFHRNLNYNVIILMVRSLEIPDSGQNSGSPNVSKHIKSLIHQLTQQSIHYIDSYDKREFIIRINVDVV